MPWYCLNRHRAERHVHTAGRYSVEFSGGIRTDVDVRSGQLRLTDGDRVLVEGSDICMPALWRSQECIAYSRSGGTREWQLPDDWHSIGRVETSRITIEGLRPIGSLPVTNGWLKLELNPGTAVLLTPA